ncbi:site-specific integrase [Aeromonas caviae]|uniref:Site-specific integrase n=1 Tax=Aeromonas caviae TaxID=648 RepID=A0AA42VCX3_AERCA|nr:site-specific integrase [Aeromonas caviae]MDH1897746.1 site-specific integrase [Aeromonas caviae]MDH1898448.1 site-specific integrase [Aeromonas caviae]
MAIMPNPKKDPKTGVYKIRQVIPPALRPFVEGKGELKRSLDTKDPQEAKAKAVEINLELQAILAGARNKLALQESKTQLTQSQVEQIARTWRLREVSRLRDPETLERYVLRELDDDGVNYEYSSLAGFYSDALEPIDVDSEGKEVYSSRRLHAAMRHFAEECLALAQVELSPEDPLYTVLCDRLAQHCVAICNTAFKATHRQIDYGIEQLLVPPIHPAGIAVATAPSAPDAPKIGEFFEKLADEQGKINPKGAITWRRERAAVVRRFIEAFGDLPLNHITSSMCREFRDQLKLTPYRPSKEINQLPFKEQIDKAQQEGLKTIALSRVEVLLHLFSGILTRAQNDALISDNPCSSIKVEVPNVTRERAPEFTDAEMNTLFDSGLFTGDIRPVRANYGEAIYWVPVLLAYTGARLEEISQLFLRDVEQKDGQWVIHIRDWDESQSVKTGKSRVVPLHPHLLELGFERFLATRATEGPLFSELKVSKSTGRYSDKLGKWLGEQIRQILGLKTGSISPLHAFRHTFVTHMRDLDIREDIQNAITGHSQGTSVGRRYGSFRQLHNAIAKMPRWPVPVWNPFSVDDVPTAAAEVQS